MAVYTTITELPPLEWPGVRGGRVFRWSDNYSGKLYQLYVNGQIAGETQSVNAPKQLAVTVTGNIVWQIIAIDPEDKGTDYSDQLDITDDQGSRIEIKWPRRSTELELGSYAKIYSDRGDGSLDYSGAINRGKIEHFPRGYVAWGFGLGGFGGVFGYDGQGLGFGVGNFGVGEFGFDSDYVVWVSEPFPPGEYMFDVVQFDSVGNSDGTGNNEMTIVVDCPPPSPSAVVVKEYDQDNDVVTLTVTAGSMAVPYG